MVMIMVLMVNKNKTKERINTKHAESKYNNNVHECVQTTTRKTTRRNTAAGEKP